MSNWLDDIVSAAPPPPDEGETRALAMPRKLGESTADMPDEGASWLDRLLQPASGEFTGIASALKTAGPHPVDISTAPAPSPGHVFTAFTDRTAGFAPPAVPTFLDPPAEALAFADGGEISLTDESAAPELDRFLAITGGSGKRLTAGWVQRPSSTVEGATLTDQPAKPLGPEATTGTSTEAARADHVHPLDPRVQDAVPSTRNITTSAPLSGGGSLTDDIVISLPVGTDEGTVAAGDDPRFDEDKVASGLRTSTGVINIEIDGTPAQDQVLTIVAGKARFQTPTVTSPITASTGLERVDDDVRIKTADSSLVTSEAGVAIGTIPAAKLTGLPAVPAGDTDAASKKFVVDQVTAAGSASAITANSGVQRTGNVLSAKLADNSLLADTSNGLSVRLADATLGVTASGLSISSAYKTTIDGAASKTYVDTQDTALSGAIAAKPNLATSGGNNGAAVTASRSDHSHSAAVSSSPGPGSAGLMTASDKNKLDTVAFYAAALVTGGGTAGSAATAARSDHSHPNATTSVAGFMSSNDKTKLDASEYGATVNTMYPTPNATAAIAGTAAGTNSGTSSFSARGDHTHPHGAQTDGSHHAVAVAGGANGFLSGTDKSKLDGIASSATNTPLVASGGNAGSAATAARSDHTHAAVVSSTPGPGSAGLMTAADKAKLDTVATNATALTLATASQSTTTAIASAGNTGSSALAARADHTHAASVDSLRAQPYVISGTAGVLDLALYDDLEWNLPTAPILGEQANPRDMPGARPTYYCTLDIQYTSPNTAQRPSGRLIFKQPSTGQITHYIKIQTPSWATGGVKGLTTITPFDATGKTLAQGGTADPPYQALVLVTGVADPPNANTTFRGQIFQYDFYPLWNGLTWTLVIGAKSNAGGGGLTLQGGAPYVVGGGGGVVTGLSLETAGDVLINGNLTANGASIYSLSTYFQYTDGLNYRYPGTVALNSTTPSTGLPTYYNSSYTHSVLEWALPNTASIGFAFIDLYERHFGYMVVKQPASGQQVNSLTFYYLQANWDAGLRGITLTNPANPSGPLTSTLTAATGTVIRDPLSPDLNPYRGAGAVTIYDYQYVVDSSGNRYVYIRKRPALPISAGNPAGLAQIPNATQGQALVVDTTGQPVWVSPRTLVRDGGVATPGTAAPAGAVMYADASGLPVFERRTTVSTSDQTYTASGYVLQQLNAAVGTYLIEFDGWYWGSAANVGIGIYSVFNTGAGNVQTFIDITTDSGTASLTGDTNSLSSRVGSSSLTPLDRNSKRAFRGRATVTVTTAGQYYLVVSANTGTGTISRGTRVRWEQIS
jgi:hypothetical protein